MGVRHCSGNHGMQHVKGARGELCKKGQVNMLCNCQMHAIATCTAKLGRQGLLT